jgi:hypothetical protein
MRIPEKKKAPSSTPGKSDPVEVIGELFCEISLFF